MFMTTAVLVAVLAAMATVLLALLPAVLGTTLVAVLTITAPAVLVAWWPLRPWAAPAVLDTATAAAVTTAALATVTIAVGDHDLRAYRSTPACLLGDVDLHEHESATEGSRTVPLRISACSLYWSPMNCSVRARSSRGV
jgi:hypothetical protein